MRGVQHLQAKARLGFDPERRVGVGAVSPAGTVTRSAAFTRPNARSGGFDNTLKLEEVATGRELRTFTG